MYITKITLKPLNMNYKPGDPYILNGQKWTIVAIRQDVSANKTILKIQNKSNNPWGATVDK